MNLMSLMVRLLLLCLWCQWFFVVAVKLGITLLWDFVVSTERKLGAVMLESLLSSVCRFPFPSTEGSKHMDPRACYSVDF